MSFIVYTLKKKKTYSTEHLNQNKMLCSYLFSKEVIFVFFPGSYIYYNINKLKQSVVNRRRNKMNDS